MAVRPGPVNGCHCRGVHTDLSLRPKKQVDCRVRKHIEPAAHAVSYGLRMGTISRMPLSDYQHAIAHKGK